MQTDLSEIATLRQHCAALHTRACDMAHERIPSGPDGAPARDPASDSGYQRAPICPASVRTGNLGCSHTSARIVLKRALDALGDGDGPLRRELDALDGAMGVLDHRRYDGEQRRADAMLAADVEGVKTAESAIAALVGEHRTLGLRTAEVRDVILLRLDNALASAPSQRVIA